MLFADTDFADAVIVMSVFGLPALLWAAVRYMKHREYMAMIQRGIAPNRAQPMPGPAQQPMGGMQQPMPGYDPFGGLSKRDMRRAQRELRRLGDRSPEGQVRSGIGTAFVGVGLTIGLGFIGYSDGVIQPGPWLLGGLIPLFVGLSQIMNGVLSGAAFPFSSRAPFGAPPVPPPPFGAPPGPGAPSPGPDGRTYDAYSYTYRPGVTPEIDAPPRPPTERR